MVIIVTGLPGSGKSYLAVRLADELQAVYASSDRIRKKMIPNRNYSAKEKESVYDEMYNRMVAAIRAKKDIVLDATFYRDSLRQKFILEAGPGSQIRIIEVTAAESLIKERLGQKRADSEADFHVYQQLKAQYEPIHDPHLTLVSTNNNISELLGTALKYIRSNHDQGADQ
ncbi:ATP-binding protein [Chitinophaga sancti]|uniref:AAA family ATPase n=1 Tax=Chitinophaga sancti TaxID=1004 RepID=UPI002A74ABE7|nr:ATP-binding protein [Chitinophaga sancti]WPQ60436.1 ATP-binding protein [Chitinophaga sancti]